MRIGLEDYQYAREGQPTNAQLTERAAGVIRAMGHEVATPEEVPDLLEVVTDAQNQCARRESRLHAQRIVCYFGGRRRSWPVISGGCSISSIASNVGATSASVP